MVQHVVDAPERSKRQNANNPIFAGWHWEERNQLAWSKQKLQELLVGIPVNMSAAQGHAKVTALKELRGEVSPICKTTAAAFDRQASPSAKRAAQPCICVLCDAFSGTISAAYYLLEV